MADRKIAVVNANIQEQQKDRIRKTAEKYGASVDFYPTNKDALPHLEDVEIIFGFGPDLVENAPNLKWFCSAAAGIDVFVKSGVFEGRDIILTNSSGSYGRSISEHIIMVTLMLMRKMPYYEELIANRQWRFDLTINSIAGRRVLVLGTGNIGSTVARRIRGFDPEWIIGVSRTGKAVEEFDKVVDVSQLDNYISETDLLLMCLPGTAETENILSAERIAMLPPTAYIVNIGRGSAIDEDALYEALMNDKIAGAALDVFRVEPLPDDSPLWQVPRSKLIITSHISGQESLQWTTDNIYNMFCEDIENYFEGRPLAHTADLKLGY